MITRVFSAPNWAFGIPLRQVSLSCICTITGNPFTPLQFYAGHKALAHWSQMGLAMDII